MSWAKGLAKRGVEVAAAVLEDDLRCKLNSTSSAIFDACFQQFKFSIFIHLKT